ncbi:type II toxin-antitoxin system RelE/ParE family toxin [Weeksellaceae bacterium TAE3-ERU29]|nr:type II toxin-antitoxin system RelE/ParE family toxin [Weeksellaceae bacterium TAE3-ERU29]
MFEIVWSDEAKEQYFKTLEFWIEHNKSNTYSIKIIDKVKEIEDKLKSSPYIGTTFTIDKTEVRRVLIFRNFSLFYIIEDTCIKVVSFWDNRRNPDEMNL